jgi:TPR repeat protein
MLGAMYLADGCAVRPSTPTEPLELLRQACDGEHVQSCFKLAKVYRRGALGISPDSKLAEECEQKGFAFAGMSELQATRAKKNVTQR